MNLDEEIRLLENKDTCEIVNMFAEKQSIYASNCKIVSKALFEIYLESYWDRRVKIGTRRIELYGIRKKLTD